MASFTALDLAQPIGHAGREKFGDLEVEVTVQDSRQSFGRVDLLVVPVAGRGQSWVEAGRVLLAGRVPGTDELKPEARAKFEKLGMRLLAARTIEDVERQL